MKCPKCGTDAQEAARFCPRCHATLRYLCPACKHEQRHGGTCEKCGVDFQKYAFASVAVSRDSANAVRERTARRSSLLLHLLLIPFNLGIPLIRSLLRGGRNDSRA